MTQPVQRPDRTNEPVFEPIGLRLPQLSLASTLGRDVDLGMLPARCVLILYPLALTPDQELPRSLKSIPAIAGCTEQLLDFKASHGEFLSRRLAIFGVSTQSVLVQRVVAEELELPFPLLSDATRTLVRALGLPAVAVGRVPRMMRLILAVRDGCIERTFHPGSTDGNRATDVLSKLGEVG